MGAGIAEVCARAGLRVVVIEVTEAALESGRTRSWAPSTARWRRTG
ncbi:3-hydroxyacyl-CoA dehydrogenase NAD-binding domain-containing protein [Amycolatopsis nalaikhensis]|uniref:3-hydroxyacyl-CoA dehydrogenase NAD-binding domain-containing protein n=1 Tax=Amycolatopsis nalaikhensis TaxID=715472 RepID=A0ABY8Y2R6_9PSEU|nr:3-hydroxyacyl-CoA dehydrogenase NAD-binding domain-containing protein [Amycolatopsis sp. 2-2]WIV62148.1 3-hydroxyacyl-CoA dehydrogenase NAD-binding domain-containing protein [Amycolatopsis sp. 2-2]